jgi:DNA-binding MarR family transcriptional regulator
MKRNISLSEHALTQGERFRRLLALLARTRTLRDPVAASCEELALSPPQIHALLRLADADTSLTMGELADRLGVSEKTVTGLVDRLEAGRYVERVRDAEDRRVVEVRLTASGQDAAERIKYAVAGRIDNFLALLDTKDREALFGIVEKLIQRLEETRRQ